MPEPTIKCPSCGTEIKLTESLAAPLIESTRRDFEKRLSQKDAEVARHEAAIREREEAVAKEKECIDSQVAEKLRQERVGIAAEESKKARRMVQDDLDKRSREMAELQEVLKQREVKLAEAQKAQAELLRKQRELDDARRELELTIEKRVQEGLGSAREQAKQEAEEQLKLKVKEKEDTISSMQRQIEDLKRSAEQGSQQLQGEVLEEELEEILREKFPQDLIEPVPKGVCGGDILQRVVNQAGTICGTIIWETKRTKNWSDNWLPKLRIDQRTAKAELAVIVSQALPRGVETFDLIDKVWVTHPRYFLPVTVALRQTIIDLAAARVSGEGIKTKMSMVYKYLTGPQFKARIEAIVEAFSAMQEDLDKEKKAITKQWAKRDAQICHIMEATVGMYGDLQGIAGKSLAEIEGISLKALSAPAGEGDE